MEGKPGSRVVDILKCGLIVVEKSETSTSVGISGIVRQDPGDGVGFPAPVQWASLFYRGQLSEETFTNDQTGIGTGPAEPSHYQIVRKLDPDSVTEELAITRVLHALQKEMAKLARNPAPMSDIEVYVYN